MNADELRGLQSPLKTRYRQEPDSASITLRARARVGDEVTCKVETGRGLTIAGLRAATGATRQAGCSGDMLLEALIACAGVTLAAVATAIGIVVSRATNPAQDSPR